ncbi:YlbG family protein [Fructobacillus americanaquae]|uniref:YlbG family protein n=1 Tax=Fructobacillus americanaquae TaxID=2940302 RepID=UPI00308466BB
MKERRSVYVFLRGLKHIEQLKKFGDISYISKRMGYVELYLDEVDVEKTIDKLNQYRFVKTVKVSPRPDIDPDLGDVHDDVFFEAYDQTQEDTGKDQPDAKKVKANNQGKDRETKTAAAGQAQNQQGKKNGRQAHEQQGGQTVQQNQETAKKGGKS